MTLAPVAETHIELEELDTLIIAEHFIGERLDKVLPQLVPNYSRANLQTFLKEGHILIDGQKMAGKMAVKGGEHISLHLPLQEVHTDWVGEAMDIDIIYEDEHLLIVNKPIDMVVHPAAGNWSGTLVNGLLHHFPTLNQLPRAGIVHRLDKDTSGLLVVAKTLGAYHSLVQQLQARTVKREYCALVYGEVIAGDTINAPLGRSRHDRQKIAIISSGKMAITHYRVRERFDSFTLLKVILETGRTHQIRVHLTSVHHPLVGDASYGHGLRLPKGVSDELKEALKAFQHQALHAERLSFIHPHTKATLRFKSPLPADFLSLVNVLREENAQALEAYDDDDDYYWGEDY
jgi:23S rRNA pseudouridine1911/1915/1917 synthase